MNTDEIVRALRAKASTLFPGELQRDMESAADLIESLQAQLSERNEKIRKMHEAHAFWMTEEMGVQRLLIAQLAASQRREKAAVEDLYRISPCDTCKHYDADNNTCARPDVHYDECFEWRGPQEAVEGRKQMNSKPTMTDAEVVCKIKALLMRDEFAAVRRERQRINQHALQRLNALFAGLKLRYIETGETVVIAEFGELFETIRATFPDGETLWCLPEEFALIEQEAGEEQHG